jgi:RNA polymerase sigma factor (sigma-70 family)
MLFFATAGKSIAFMLFKFKGLSDKQLVEAIQHGQPEALYEAALIQLYEQFESKAIKYLLKNHQVNKEEAQEITREALINLIENIQSAKYEGRGSLYGYYMGILKNQVKTWMNQRHNWELPDRVDDDVQSPENQFLAKESWQTIERILAQLSNPKCREILLASEDESTKELAARLGYGSANTLYVTRNECKQKLKEILQKEGYNGKDGKK